MSVDRIEMFIGQWRWLSNFYPCKVRLDGDIYPSVEHAYQAAKTLDLAERDRIRGLLTPGEAKRAGRKVVLRPNWDEEKLNVMRILLRRKFENQELRDKLIATGDAELIEGNYWNDRFWGMTTRGGQNWLGVLLMELRSELQGKA